MWTGPVPLFFILAIFALGVDSFLDFYASSYTHRVLRNLAAVLAIVALIIWHGGK